MKLHLIFLLTLTILFAGCKDSKEQTPPIEISAEQLILEYKHNSYESDRRFKDQALAVSGRVINYSIINNTIGVSLESSDPVGKWWVMCFIDRASQPDAYSKLGRGKAVTAIGTGHHKKDSFLISLDDCKIEYK